MRVRDRLRAIKSLARSGQPGASAQQIYDAEVRLHQTVVEPLDHMRRCDGTGLWDELLATRNGMNSLRRS